MLVNVVNVEDSQGPCNVHIFWAAMMRMQEEQV